MVHAQFLGGAGDGHANFVFVSPVACPWYNGGDADGSAQAIRVNPDTCGQYEGGFQDGAAFAFLPNPDSCGQFEGGLADGMSRGFLANPVPCTAFFASQQDGSTFGYLSCTPLEVNASELFGRNEGQDALLWWYTFSEVNNLGFIVQRSNDQLNWTEIAFVDGQTNSNSRVKYELRDETMQEGINYYRWEQVDYTGLTSISNIVALVKVAHAKSSLVIYPNPVSQGNALNVNFQAAQPSIVTIQIVDGFGRNIWESDYPATLEPLQTQIPTESLAAGVYFLVLKTETERISRRFVLQ